MSPAVRACIRLPATAAYGEKRTFDKLTMSVKGHFRTHAPQQAG